LDGQESWGLSMLIDSHCHLDSVHQPKGALETLARARAAGVVAFVCVGVGPSLDVAHSAATLAEQQADVFATVGIQPHDARTFVESMWAELARLARNPRVVAIGETGLDFFHDLSPRDVQRKVFRRMIELALEVGKPIVVHTRGASEETLQILESDGASRVGGIIHCFSEDLPFAERALALDFDLSFSGLLTFSNADKIRRVAAQAPADRILVETDSPYLAPVPMRGRACEPAYVVHTARELAQIRGVSFEMISAQTTSNAVRRLSLPATLAGQGIR
jgi:TatD DNase family protein